MQQVEKVGVSPKRPWRWRCGKEIQSMMGCDSKSFPIIIHEMYCSYRRALRYIKNPTPACVRTSNPVTTNGSKTAYAISSRLQYFTQNTHCTCRKKCNSIIYSIVLYIFKRRVVLFYFSMSKTELNWKLYSQKCSLWAKV